MQCKRINLFIGDPNSGKSNILELLAFLSTATRGGDLSEYVRFNSLQNLFYDDLTENPINIEINGLKLHFNYEFDRYVFKDQENLLSVRYNHEGNPEGSSSSGSTDNINKLLDPLKIYKYREIQNYTGNFSDYLLPPQGENLFAVIYSNKHFRETVKNYFNTFGFLAVFKPQEKKIEMQKQVDDVIISYPYSLTSDTMKTMIFYSMAIDSNKNSTLVFEEPEAHTFPYYTKLIAEKIAKDESNQYFIATHNPYFLTSIIEKSPKDSVAINVTYFDDYQTKIVQLNKTQIAELLELDPFFNLKKFYKK